MKRRLLAKHKDVWHPASPGWYQHQDKTLLRYFDGRRWHNRYRPIPGWSAAWTPATNAAAVRQVRALAGRRKVSFDPRTRLFSAQHHGLWLAIFATLAAALLGLASSLTAVRDQQRIESNTLRSSITAACAADTSTYNSLALVRSTLSQQDQLTNAELSAQALTRLATNVRSFDVVGRDATTTQLWREDLARLAQLTTARTTDTIENQKQLQDESATVANRINSFARDNNLSQCIVRETR